MCAVLTVLVLLTAIALFARAYHRAGSSVSDAGGSGFGATGPALGPPPAVVSTAPATSAPGGAADPHVVPATVLRTLTEPAGPGFTVVPAARHRLVLGATSTAAIGTVGYLVPTSSKDDYGSARQVGTRWSLRTTVTGKPYYAAIFVQAGAAGTSITCTIRLDGKLVSSASTKGAYGQQVCYA